MKLSALFCSSLTLGMLLASTHSAVAGERQHARALKSGTYTSTTTRTGPNGKTMTRDSQVVVDRDAGTMVRDTTMTGPNGKTATTHAEVNRTDNGMTRDVVRTGPSGQTQTVHSEVVVDKDTGTTTRNKTISGPKGDSTVRATVQKTDDGYTRDVVRTGPNGKTQSTSTDVSIDKQAGTATRTTTVTGPNGNTATTTTTKTFTPKP